MKRIYVIASLGLLICLPALFAKDAKAHSPARIALLSDVHIMRGTNRAQNALHRRHFDEAIADINAAKVDVVLIAGDLTEKGTPEELGDFRAQMSHFKAPVYVVPGNHDVGNKLIPGKEANPKGSGITGWRVARYELRWGSSFFTRTRAGVRIIGLNAPLIGTGFWREKQMWNMLEKQLARPSSEPTIVFTHFPLYEKKVDEPGGGYFNLEPDPRQRVVHLLRQGQVKAVLSGHTHKQIINRMDGILYVTTPPVAFGLPRGKQKPGWTLVTVPTQGPVRTEFRYIPE